MTDFSQAVDAYFPTVIDTLTAHVAIPSISNEQFDTSHVRESAEFVADRLRELGADWVDIRSVPRPDGTDGAPAVVAHFAPAPGAPTVLLYAHHDVQPIPDPAEWRTDPFTPTRDGDRLYGRGAADDKAGLAMHLAALAVLGSARRVGVTFFIEGEEEIGSPSFAEFLRANAAALEADVIIVADSGNWAIGKPALTTSLRGLVEMIVEVRVLDHAVHSGMFGGAVLDAHVQAARLVASLHDAHGDVAVEGLVTAPDPDVDFTEEQMRADSGLLPGGTFAGTGPYTARMWTKPALSVVGWDVVPVSHASNTIAPRARLKLSLRIPPGQDPQAAFDAVRDHLVARAEFGTEVTITPKEFGQAFSAPATSPAMAIAREAFAQAWGTDPVDMGVGGSIPFIAELATVFPHAQILVTGVEDPDSRAHGANESIYLPDLKAAILAEVLILHRLGGE